MRAFILSALMSTALLGCGTTPRQDRQHMNAVTCKRVFQCLTAEEAQNAHYGASEAECVAKLEEIYAPYESDERPCPDGKTWRSDKARACASYLESLSCDKVRNEGLTGSGSPDCGNICS